MIRILHLASPGIGGIENYIFTHYRYMDRSQFRFDFLTQNPGLKDAEEFKDFEYEVKLLPTTAAKDPERFAKQVRTTLMDGYDILHLHTCYWTGFLIEEIAKEVGIKKVIVHSHSTFIDECDQARREQLLQRHEAVKREFSAGLATDFWACSWMAADWLFGSQIPREKICIMKNAIDLERFRFDQGVREQVRAELGIEDSTFVFGTAGRLSFQKNHAFLIQVFQIFYKQHPNSRLIIVGDGELRSSLEKQIEESGLNDSVLLLGWQASVEKYLFAMDGFLLPSRFEGLGIAVVEAAASGLPCIVSDQVPKDVAFHETIRHVPLCVSDWLDGLEELTRLSVNRMEGAVCVGEAGYDIRRQAKMLEKLYKEV